MSGVHKVQNVLLILMLGATCGCTPGLTKFPVAETIGKVKCEGNPVANAIVYFEPVRQGESANVGQMGYATTNADGEFSVGTYGDKDGAVVGKHIVRVGSSESSGQCPCSLDAMKELMRVDIASDKINEFAIDLPK